MWTKYTLQVKVCPPPPHYWILLGPMMQDQVIELFRLQLVVHHPLGVHCGCDGYWATNDDTWCDVLYKLYDTLIGELQFLSKAVRWGDNGLSRPIIDLTVDVMHQVSVSSQLHLTGGHTIGILHA